jgi:hypothetical protein
VPTKTLTPTFDPLSVVTATRAPAAACPPTIENPPRPDFLYDAEYLSGPGTRDLIDQTIEYVRTYGPLPVTEAFKAREEEEGLDYLFQDLTNDGIPEFGFGFIAFRILGCVNGQYEQLYAAFSGVYLSAAHITYIGDQNKNGILEFLLNTGIDPQGGRAYNLVEWNGSKIDDILFSFWRNEALFSGVFVEGNTELYFEDLDHDGYQELVFYQGIPVWSTYHDGLPWRRVKDYYRWNGYFYSLYKQDYDPPVYRFQAVRDADYASKWQEYDKALALYQQVIFSDTLKPWSAGWLQYEQTIWLSSNSGDPTPTPPPDDPKEFPFLEAYSRYRIMLLHVVGGYLSEAKIVYDTLQEKFPEGQPGHIYAELAQIFWNEYQASQSIEQSCTKASLWAIVQDADIFYYISSDFHGWQNPSYEREDFCPFK